MSEPRRTGLLKMLRESAGTQYVIPVYQRNYTWTEKNEVKQFLNDLKSIIDKRYDNHFMGIMIYLEKSIDYRSRECLVIDGQQRLTTTFLTLYAVKELLLNSQKDDEANDLEQQYLINPHSNEKVKFKLKPLINDDDVYQKIIEDKINEVDKKDSLIYKNYIYIKKELSKIINQGKSINDILDAIEKMYIVCIPIEDKDNPQKIFESINATGQKLTSADLIRNYLLMNLDSQTQEDYYANYWMEIEKNVSNESKKLEAFFRIYLSIKKYELITESKVYREFVDWQESRNNDIEDTLKEVVKYAKYYNDIMNKNLNLLDKELRPLLDDYRKINSIIPSSVLLEFYGLYVEDKIKIDDLANIIQTINSFMLRRGICSLRDNNISRLFPATLKKVMESTNGNYTDIVKIFNQALVFDNSLTKESYMPTDEQMKDVLYKANVYDNNSDDLKIIFDRIELYQNSAPVDLSSLSIEHLMPQTPTKEWLDSLNITEEEYFKNLHRLGNLTLATKHDNSEMSNKPWEYKNEILKDTAHLKMNMELLNISDWNIKEIDKRTKSLIDKICKIYPYPTL